MKKIAIPTERGKLCPHFGHCAEFTIATVDNDKIIESVVLAAPVHEHGSHPRFLAEQGCTELVCGGLGDHAKTLLAHANIEVHAGAPAIAVEQILQSYLDGTIQYGDGTCHHEGCGGHHHHHEGGARVYRME